MKWRVFMIVAVLTLVVNQCFAAFVYIDRVMAPIMVYRVPNWLGTEGISEGDRRALAGYRLPSGNASADETRNSLRHVNRLVTEALKSQGLSFCEESFFVYDPASHTMAAYTDANGHEKLDTLEKSLLQKNPQLVPWRVSIVEAESAAVLKAFRDGGSGTTAADLLKTGRLVSMMSGTASRDQLSSSSTGAQWSPSDGVRKLGSAVEMAAGTSTDGKVVFPRIDLHHQYGESLSADGMLNRPPVFDLSTDVGLLSAVPLVVGVWTLHDFAHFGEATHRMQAALVSFSPTYVLPAENGRVADLLTRFDGLRALPKEAPLPRSLNVPKGMIEKSFRLDAFVRFPDVMDDSAVSVPSDPFRGPSSLTMWQSIEELLRCKGVEFPPGATCSLSPANGRLMMVNTPESMKRIEAISAEMLSYETPRILLEMQVVTAPSKNVLAWQEMADKTDDDTQVWDEVEVAIQSGAAKVAGVLATVANPWSRTAISAGPARIHAQSLEDARAWPPSEDVYGMSAVVDASVGSDTRTVMLSIEVDVDMSPPQKAKTGELVFFTHETTTSLVVVSGQWNLVSSWKPIGTKELDSDVLQAMFVRASVQSLGRVRRW